MKEITLKKCIDDLENSVLIEDIYQNTDQYDNYGAKLYQVGKAVIYVEDLCNQTNKFLLEKGEIKQALADPEDFLKICITEWIYNDEDPDLAEFQWSFQNPEDWQYEGHEECKILIVSCYNGYQPLNWLKHDNDNIRIFKNSQAAQAWIDDADDATYYLSHNEAGRPAYYIIEE